MHRVWIAITYYRLPIIGPFRHSDISVKAVNQHGGRVLIYIVWHWRMLNYGAVTWHRKRAYFQHFIAKCSGDGTATATAAMAAPLFTAEINSSLVINYNCNLDRRPRRRSITTYCVNLRQLLALLFKQDGCEF